MEQKKLCIMPIHQSYKNLIKKEKENFSPVGCIWKRFWKKYNKDPHSSAFATVLIQVEIEGEMKEKKKKLSLSQKGLF